MTEGIQHGTVAGTDDAELAARIHEVAVLQDELLAELVGLGATMSAAMDALPGFVPCGHAFGVVIEGLAACAGRFEPDYLRQLIEAVRARSEHVSDHRGVAQGVAKPVRAELASAAGDEASGQEAALRASLLAALLGIAPYAQRAMELGVMSDDVDVALARGLAALGDEQLAAHELHVVFEQVAAASLAALALEV